MKHCAGHYKFVIGDLVKQSVPGRKQPELILPAFRTTTGFVFTKFSQTILSSPYLTGVE